MMIVDEIFIPKRRIVIVNPEQIQHYISVYNGKKNIYQSVYHYKNKPSAINAIVDKVFLDFDYDDDLKFYDDVKKVAKYLHKHGIRFYIRFSGRGFHIFIMVQNNLKQPKLAIKQWVNEMHRRTNTKSDPAVIGDTRRVCRVLGTKNLKTNLYCIPLEYSDLQDTSYQDICNRAKTYFGKKDCINGDILLDLSEYDKPLEQYSETPMHINTDSLSISTEYPSCIQRLLSIPDLGYHERRELIIYLRDYGFGEEEIMAILEKSLSHQKFVHCVEEEHQLQYLMQREDILFSSCRSQKLNGICPSQSCTGNDLYL